MVYHKPTFGQALMYIKHNHMEYSELHTCHDLFFDQKVNDNAYSTPLLREALYMYHKMAILGIGFITINFHIFVCNIRIILNMIFSVGPFYYTGSFSLFFLINYSMFPILFRHMFWNYLSRLKSLFFVQECIRIRESNNFDPGS